MDRTTIGRFFDALFTTTVEGAYLHVSTIDVNGQIKPIWLQVSENMPRENALEKLENLVSVSGKNKNVYVSGAFYPKKSRKAEGVGGIYGLWIDLDFGTSGHKNQFLPPTKEDALALLAHLPKPTMVIFTGHGLQVWWIFREPWVFEAPEDHTKAAQYSGKMQHALKLWAASKGWKADNVGDLSRLMRVPGTYNMKDETPIIAEIVSEKGPRWNPDDLIDAIILPEGVKSTPQITVVNTDELAGDLIVAPDRAPHARKFNALMVASRKFRNYYDGKETPDDPTGSGIDFNLALIAAKANWSSQEICDLLIMACENRGQPVKQKHYYQKTIGKVLGSTRDEAKHTQNIDELKELRKPSPEKTPDEQQGDLHEGIKKALGIDFPRVTYLVGTRNIGGELVKRGIKTYRFVGPSGNADLPMSSISSQKLFRDSLSEVDLFIRTSFTNKDWVGIAADISESAIAVSMGEGETPEGPLIELIRRWVINTVRHDPRSQMRLADKGAAAPFLWPEGEDAKITIGSAALARKIHVANIDIKNKGVLLAQIGAQNKTVGYRDGAKIYNLDAWVFATEGAGNELWRDLALDMAAGLTGLTQKQLDQQENEDSW